MIIGAAGEMKNETLSVNSYFAGKGCAILSIIMVTSIIENIVRSTELDFSDVMNCIISNIDLREGEKSN